MGSAPAREIACRRSVDDVLVLVFDTEESVHYLLIVACDGAGFGADGLAGNAEFLGDGDPIPG